MLITTINNNTVKNFIIRLEFGWFSHVHFHCFICMDILIKLCVDILQMNSRDDPDKTYKVALPDNNYATVYLRDAMSVEEFLANACARKNLNPMEHFVRVKKRRDMEDHNYFVPHRNDLIETYVSILYLSR